jgi:SRSO17 transposase
VAAWQEAAAKKQWSGRGRPTSAICRNAESQPISAKALALALPRKDWRRVTWREGSNTMLRSRFAAVRVRPAHRDYEGSKPRVEEWCLIEWPPDEPEPTKYWLSTLPAKTSRCTPVNTAKLRWRIDRNYQDLKQELALGQYEGRGWRGFHHHATLCTPALRPSSFSPLRTTLRRSSQRTSHTRKLSTPRIPRSDQNACARLYNICSHGYRPHSPALSMWPARYSTQKLATY